jgi:hypothetical protein
MRLWVQPVPVPVPVHVPVPADGTVTVPMAWPPLEVVLRATKPSLQHLFDQLALSCPQEQEHGQEQGQGQGQEQGQGQGQEQEQGQRRGILRVFKWQPMRGEWAELGPDPSLANLPEPTPEGGDKGTGGSSSGSGSWSLTFSTTKRRYCQSEKEVQALAKAQETARRKALKTPATVAPAKLVEGDLLAVFTDPGLPVPPPLGPHSQVEKHSTLRDPGAVCRGICRPEDAYMALLLGHAEAERKARKGGSGSGSGGSYLASAELSGARALAAKNAAASKQGQRGKGTGGGAKPEAALRLNLDFSDDEDEDEEEADTN